MNVLGIESSCDECAAAVVRDGKVILSNVVRTQIPFHAEYNGVVPEVASRKHTEWISAVVKDALDGAEVPIDAVAATAQPGLLGSLLVGLNFAKAFAWARRLPFVACDHILAHLYASRLAEEAPPDYPFLGLLVSGGHSIICKVDDFDAVTVLGTTVDDAAGEAFDKVSKHYGFGYPGGRYIDELAARGDDGAFRFPLPKLHDAARRYDVSYSGLKTAVIHQLDTFAKKPPAAYTDAATLNADIAASFQKAAVEILLRALARAVEDTGIKTVVSGGGVAANSWLRRRLAEHSGISAVFPPTELCGDNGAMIAGIAYQYLLRGESSPMSAVAQARVKEFMLRRTR
jgi:N6-L-threonylcarbamoyladenine synthase